MDTLTAQSNLWQHYFGVSKEIAFQTVVPTAITLFVFIAGLIFNRWRENSLTLFKLMYNAISKNANLSKLEKCEIIS